MPASALANIFPSPITVLVGHAGVGKTNTALALALAFAGEGLEVTLADLDVVNPYFRSSDYPELLDEAGVSLIAPVFARTTLDTPSLTGELGVAIAQAAAAPHKRLIIDVGGDDDGATAIGGWSKQLTEAQAEVLYMVSAYRGLTTSPAEAAELLPGIEQHAHLRATGLVNASNLGNETRIKHVHHGRDFGKRVAKLLDLPLKATIVPAVATPANADHVTVLDPESIGVRELHPEPLISVPRLLKLPWQN